MYKISTELRRELFDLLCSNSSADFTEYLRAYEGLPRPLQESFEVSCDLINGIRVDTGRVAIFDLQRVDVLRWLSACRRKIPSIQEILFQNATDECFMVGLADYPSGSGGCRLKIYNEYASSRSLANEGEHVQLLFSLLNIPDIEFIKDKALFKKIKISAIEWDHKQQVGVKVYFGPFRSEQLIGDFSEALIKDEISCYDFLRKKGLLPETFHLCVRYSREGRSIKTELCCETRRVVPYLRMFDHQRQAAKFFADLYRIFPALRLEFLSLQWVGVQKVQFYYKVC